MRKQKGEAKTNEFLNRRMKRPTQLWRRMAQAQLFNAGRGSLYAMRRGHILYELHMRTKGVAQKQKFIYKVYRFERLESWPFFLCQGSRLSDRGLEYMKKYCSRNDNYEKYYQDKAVSNNEWMTASHFLNHKSYPPLWSKNCYRRMICTVCQCLTDSNYLTFFLNMFLILIWH